MGIIPIQGLNAIAWTLCSVAIVLTGGRVGIRYRRLGTLHADDYLNILALAFLIAFIATYQVYVPIQYEVELAGLGLSTSVPSADQQVFLLKVELANEMLFWCTIFAVKFAFLASYWYIFNVSAAFRRAWGAITAYIVLTFGAILPSPAWQCGDPAKYADITQCNLPQPQLTLNLITYWCVLNVIGDLLIFALPCAMLRKLHMGRADKLGLGFIFSLVLLIVLFDILRSVFTIDTAATSFPDSNAVWALCEPTIAVMVCTLPSYRSVVGSKRPQAYSSYQDMLRESEMANSRNTRSKGSGMHRSGGGSTAANRSVPSDHWEMDSMNERSIGSAV